MGRPSGRLRSARRPGRRERARVKKQRRHSCWASVGGAGTFHVKAGRKKYGRVCRFAERVLEAHLLGESITLKDWRGIKRPLYTISLA